MKITKWKAEEVAKAMTAGLVEKKNAAFENLRTSVQRYVEANTPLDVKEMAEKYPNMNGNETLRACFKGPKNPEEFSDVCVTVKVVSFMWRYGSEIHNKEIERLALSYLGAKKLARDMRDRTECAILKAGAVARLKNEFPEAYEIYMGLESNVKDSCICDDIEKLRAEYKSLGK